MAQNPTERLCKELLVDLWANALRRLKEGRFIDAVAGSIGSPSWLHNSDFGINMALTQAMWT